MVSAKLLYLLDKYEQSVLMQFCTFFVKDQNGLKLVMLLNLEKIVRREKLMREAEELLPH